MLQVWKGHYSYVGPDDVYSDSAVNGNNNLGFANLSVYGNEVIEQTSSNIADTLQKTIEKEDNFSVPAC